MKANGASSLPLLDKVNVRSIRMVPRPIKQVSRVVGLPGKASSSSLCRLLGRLRFRHISLLVALDEHRNLHRAAQAAFMAQPTASKLIQDLESLFGSPLFDRVPRGMQPTELGAVVLAFARHALGDLKRLSTELERRQAGHHGSFIIGAITDLLPPLVAHAISELKRRRPTLAVQLLDVSGENVPGSLTEGRFDVALGYFRGDPDENELDYKVIARESLCIVGRPDHPLTREPQRALVSLESTAWILNPRIVLVSKMLDRSFLRAGVKAPKNVVESSSLVMTMNLLQNSDAVSILPESIVREYLNSGRLSKLQIPIADRSIELGMMTLPREAISTVAVEFAELLWPLDNYGECASQS